MTAVDVGDAVELTFTTVIGSTVTVSWLDPYQDAVYESDPVAENPAASGLFPRTFLPTAPGVWTVVFTASGAATAVERYYIRASNPAGPPPLATVGDVGSQMSLTAAQQSLAEVLLRAASSMIRARYPVDVMIADGRLDADLVALAATNMVLRVLRNPGGLRAETVGPFSRTYDTTYAAGLLVLTKDDVALLTPTVTTSQAAPIGTAMLRAGLAPPPYGVWRGRGW